MLSPTALLADRRLLGLLAFAALLRLVIGLDVFAHDPTASALLSDSLYYRDWAAALAGGAPFPFEGDSLAYWMPPLYAQMLAWLSASTVAMLVVQGLAGLVTLLLVVAIGELLFADEPGGRTAALLGGLLWTLYGPVIFFEGRLLGATFATLFAALAMGSLLRWLATERSRELVWLGLFLGLMSLIRPNTLLAIPALALLVAYKSRATGRTALLLVPAFLVLAPAMLHNWRATGGLMPVTANGGINFYFGNNPASHGTFHAPGLEWGSIHEQRATARRLAAGGLGLADGAVDDRAASRYWFGRGLDFLTGEPSAALALFGLKAADLVSSTEFGIQYNLAAARARAPSLWLACLPFGALLFLAVLGWKREFNALALAWLGAGALSALAYFTYSRFRLPLLPLLVPFAGLGLLRLSQRAVQAPQLLLGGALLALSFVPFEGSYPRHLESHAFADMAAALPVEPATRSERAELLDAALELVPGNKPALVARAAVALEASEPQRALESLEAAVRLAIEFPSAEFELARLLAAIPDPALRDLRRARAITAAWLAGHPADHPAAESFRQLAAALQAAN